MNTKGPLTQYRDALATQWRFKAETLVRWFRELGMSEEAKVEFLANEFSGVQMYFEARSERGVSAPEPHPDTVRLDALERRLFVLRVWMQHSDDGDTLRNLADRLITPPPNPEI